jgi:predicted N-acetyltransferase YhbS
MTRDAPAGLSIRAEARDEQGAVRSVHALAFGDGERVPDLVDALRAAGAALPPLSFVADLGGRVVGHIMLSACRLGWSTSTRSHHWACSPSISATASAPG